MVEWAGLENRNTRKRIVGSNPTLSATSGALFSILFALLVVPGVDESVEAVVEEIRRTEQAGERDEKLAEALSELRLLKDAWEVEQLQLAVDTTIEGFEKIVRALPEAVAHRRGERVIEGTFLGHARLEGNYVGYETIAAAGE